MRHKKIILNLLLGLFLVIISSKCVLAVENKPGVPGKLIMDYIEKGLDVLKNPALSGPDKLVERKEKLWHEIAPIFNFSEMCKRALGRQWKELPNDKQGEFTELFTEVLKDGYIGKTDSYSSEKIIYKREISDSKRSKVQTILVTTGGQEVSVNFRLFNNNQKWEIYDIIIEGVSLVSNYRSQFNSYLMKHTIDELIVKMQKKISAS